MALETNQVHALAATVGLLEARIDIERNNGTKPPRGVSTTAAQLCYRALSTAFPELEYLFDGEHLGGCADPGCHATVCVAEVSEPCS